METLFLIILFIAPGMVCRELKQSFNKECRHYENTYDYLMQIVLDSIVTNALTIFFLHLIGFKLLNFDDLTIYLFNFKTGLYYLGTLLIIILFWAWLKNSLILKGYVFVKNRILKKKEYREHSIHTTDWDDMINENDIAGSWQVISIYKDDKYITSGMRHSSSTTNADQFEIRVDKTHAVKRMMEEHPDIFKVEYDYYNVTTGLRVIMYDQTLIEEHWYKYN